MRTFTFRLTSQGVEELKRDLESLGVAGKRVFDGLLNASPGLAKGLNAAEQAMARSKRELEDLSRRGTPAMKALGAAGQEVEGAMRGLASQVPVVGGAISALGPAGLVAAAAIGAVTLGVSKAVSAYGEAERSIKRLDAVLRASGEGIGLTRKELAALEQQVKGSSFFGDTEIRAAEAALALNKGIRGEQFKEAIRLAGDLSEVLGGDLAGNAIKVGKAFQDPIKGLEALRKAGLDFGDGAEATIRAMVETGDKAGAASRLMEELRRSIGGAAAGAHGGVSGEIDQLGKNWDDFWENAGQRIAQSGVMTYVADINKALAAMNAHIAAGGMIDPFKTFMGAPGNPEFDLLQKRMDLGRVNERLAGAADGPFKTDLLAQQRDLLKEIADLQLKIGAEASDGAGAVGGQKRDFIAAAGAGDRGVAAEMKEAADAAAEVSKAQDDILAKLGDTLRLAKLTARERFIEQETAKAIAELDGKKVENLDAFTAKTRAAAAAIYDAQAAQAAANKSQQESERLSAQEAKARDAAAQSIAAQIATLQDEQAQLKMTEAERFVHVELLKAEETARRGGIELTEEQVAQIRQEARSLFELGEARDKAARAEQERERAAERAASQRQREMERAAEQQAEMMRRPWINALEGIQTAGADFLQRFLDGSLQTFSEVAKGARSVLTRLFAELANVHLLRPVFGGLLGGLGLGGTAANLGLGMGGGQSVGGLGGGATGFGGISLPGGIGTPFVPGSGTGGLSLGSLFPGGSVIGNWLHGTNGAGTAFSLMRPGVNPALGPQSVFGSIGWGGAALGGILSAAPLALQGNWAGAATAGVLGAVGTAFGGPIGGIIGGTIGNLLGGLFGKKKPKLKKHEAEAWLQAGPLGYPMLDYTTTSGKVPAGMGGELGDLALDAIGLTLGNAGATLDPATRLRLSYYHSTKGKKTKSEFYKATMFADLSRLGLKNLSGEIARYPTVEEALSTLSAGALFSSALQGRVAGTGATTQSAFRHLYTDGGRNRGAMANVPKDVDRVMEIIDFTKWIDGFDKVRTTGDAAQKAINDFNASLAKFGAEAQDLGIANSKVLAAMRRDFTEGVAEELLALTDPQQLALRELEKEYAARKATAAQLGASLVELEKLYALKRQQILDQGLQGVASSWKEFINGLQFGESSALPPAAQREQARLQYEAAKSVGGQTFRDAATTYLALQRDAFGGTQRYTDLFAEVIALAKQFGGLAGIPGYAGGTDWHPGGLALVGEQGAELVNLPTGSRVTDADRTAQLLRGLSANDNSRRGAPFVAAPPIPRTARGGDGMDGAQEMASLRHMFGQSLQELRLQSQRNSNELRLVLEAVRQRG